MTKNDIIARLQKGEDIDAIAAEFTNLLNDAQREYAAKYKKKTAAEELAVAFNIFLESYYPNLTKNAPVTSDELIELFDALSELVGTLGDLTSVFKPKTKSKSKEDTDKEIIETFLQSLQL